MTRVLDRLDRLDTGWTGWTGWGWMCDPKEAHLGRRSDKI